MLTRLRGTGRHVGRHRERQPDRVARRRVGVLPDDEHPHVVERLLERPQHVRARRAGSRGPRRPRPQELPERRDGRRPPAPAPPPTRGGRARRGRRAAYPETSPAALVQAQLTPPLPNADDILTARWPRVLPGRRGPGAGSNPMSLLTRVVTASVLALVAVPGAAAAASALPPRPRPWPTRATSSPTSPSARRTTRAYDRTLFTHWITITPGLRHPRDRPQARRHGGRRSTRRARRPQGSWTSVVRRGDDQRPVDLRHRPRGAAGRGVGVGGQRPGRAPSARTSPTT